MRGVMALMGRTVRCKGSVRVLRDENSESVRATMCEEKERREG